MKSSNTAYAQGHTSLPESRAAGEALGNCVNNAFGDVAADVVIVFASSSHNYQELLESIKATCKPVHIMGCSSAGEFAGRTLDTQSASILAIRSSEMHFKTVLGHGLQANPREAARQCTAELTGRSDYSYPYRTALIFTNALAVHVEELIDGINIECGGAYQLVGGGAGDDANFCSTHVFHGTEAHQDAVVLLEILSHKPIGIGAAHGWNPSSDLLRVTEAKDNRVYSLNGLPAEEVFAEYAEKTGQTFDRASPVSFFLFNVVGIQEYDKYKLRVPLVLHEDGSISFAANIPTGSIVRLMSATMGSTCDAASIAALAAKTALGDSRVATALIFDCAATRLRLAPDFGEELKAVETTLGSDRFAGCITYGQIVRVHGQFSGFHNGTAVVCAFPE